MQTFNGIQEIHLLPVQCRVRAWTEKEHPSNIPIPSTQDQSKLSIYLQKPRRPNIYTKFAAFICYVTWEQLCPDPLYTGERMEKKMLLHSHMHAFFKLNDRTKVYACRQQNK